MDVTANWEDKMMSNGKKVATLICGMFGCVFLGGGDWLMMYGNTAYHGQDSIPEMDGIYECAYSLCCFAVCEIFSSRYALSYWFYQRTDE